MNLKKLLFYYLVSFAVIFTAIFLFNMERISSDGKYIIQPTCLSGAEVREINSSNHFECFEYGNPEYIPLGKKINKYLLYSTILAIFGVLLIEEYKQGKKEGKAEEEHKKWIDKMKEKFEKNQL